MIVPYIVESDAQATSLTRSISERFELIDLPASVTPVQTPPAPAPGDTRR
jgi:hypothetical protein